MKQQNSGKNEKGKESKCISEMKIKLEETQKWKNTTDNALRKIKDEKRKVLKIKKKWRKRWKVVNRGFQYER